MTHLKAWQEQLAPEETAVIFSTVSRRYLTGFTSSDGVLVTTREEALLYLDSRYYEMAQIAQSRGRIPENVILRPFIFPKEFEERIKDGLVSKVLFEDKRLTVSELRKLERNFADAEFLPIGERLDRLRMVKDRDEIRAIAGAQALAEEALAHLLPLLSPDRTETWVAAELERYMKLHGAEKPSFETICISGTRTSLPHGRPENIKLTDGGFLTMDFGCVLDGYCSDMTRTVCIGRATEEMKTVYNTVLRAQLAGVAAAKAGVSGKDVDKASRDVITEAGYGEYFGHSTGHGCGLQVHEAPYFAPKADNLIPAGAVLSVEPGIYLPGRFGVRIEDLIAVTENGCENLNRSSKELVEIV
ncbi:MAG: aminopeptidase P family protein [Clostridia bacterium]|nr:aminopeptidase P family protein [Clostridia bacterium]